MKSGKVIQILFVASSLVSLIVGLYVILTNLLLAGLCIALGSTLAIVFVILRRKEPYEFEVVYNYVDLDILDNNGKELVYTKRTKIKSMKSNVLYYVEDMSSDGCIDSFEVSPGAIESVKPEEGKILVKTSFGHPLEKNEEIVREFKCKFHNSFCNDREYWVQRQSYPSAQFQVTIHFPKERAYKDYRCSLKVGVYEKASRIQPKETVINGRPCLVWKVDEPALKDSYKLEWVW